MGPGMPRQERVHYGIGSEKSYVEESKCTATYTSKEQAHLFFPFSVTELIFVICVCFLLGF